MMDYTIQLSEETVTESNGDHFYNWVSRDIETAISRKAGCNRVKLYFELKSNLFPSLTPTVRIVHRLYRAYGNYSTFYIESNFPVQFWQSYFINCCYGFGFEEWPTHFNVGLRIPLATWFADARTAFLGDRPGGLSEHGFLRPGKHPISRKTRRPVPPGPFVTFYCPQWLQPEAWDLLPGGLSGSDGKPPVYEPVGMDLLDEGNTLFVEAEQKQVGHPWQNSPCSRLQQVYFDERDMQWVHHNEAILSSSCDRKRVNDSIRLRCKYREFLMNQARILGIPVIEKL